MRAVPSELGELPAPAGMVAPRNNFDIRALFWHAIEPSWENEHADYSLVAGRTVDRGYRAHGCPRDMISGDLICLRPMFKGRRF